MRKIIAPILQSKKTLTIGLFAPSEPINSSRLACINKEEKRLKLLGFNVKKSDEFFFRIGSNAGSPEDRAESINKFVNNSDIDILMGAWGGKGAIELLSLLDYNAIRSKRKVIIGSSDVGVILNAITSKSKLITFFGPNVFGKLSESKYKDLKFLKKNFLVSGKNILDDKKGLTLVSGISKGRLFGGNIDTFIHANAGTPYSIAPEEGILFFESSEYSPQKIRQQFYALYVRGILDKINGLIIGDLGRKLESKKWEYEKPESFVLELSKFINKPTIYAPYFGHGNLLNPVFPIGCLCELNANSGTIMLLEDCIF